MSIWRNAIRSLIILVALLLIAAAAAAGWFYWIARNALPQLDGSISVPGLSKPVLVIRDGLGVPDIRAATIPDLLLAQGYITAQDRLWQMDMMRRYAGGELSEILGESVLPLDRQQRILGLRDAADHALARMPQRDRAFLEAYANGVNAAIERQRGRWPVEFHLLRYEPQVWRPRDSLLLAAYMCQMLNHYTFETELARERILSKLGPDLTAELYPASSLRDKIPGAEGTQIPVKRAKVAETRFPSVAGRLLSAEQLVAGSNNWVVSGAHTASGKPLLANDMHLMHQMPNLWYEAHLECGDYDVAGVTLPGSPFVIVGHNRRIAWGFTNLGPDVEDIYIESFNEKGEYLTPQGWKQPERRPEVIRIKGRPDVTVLVTITRHGPIVSDLVPGESRKLALRWTIYDPSVLAIPLFDINSARNWEEFRRASSRFGAPGQNVVYADVEGHIGYQATGLIPIRTSGDGTVPVSGSDDAHEWTGYIPFEQLPCVFDPPEGILATANGRVVSEDAPRLLTTEWAPPYRTERIYRVLESGKRLVPSDMLALQNDVFSDFDQRLAALFTVAVDHTTSASVRARQAADLMRSWDGRLTRDSAGSTVVAVARRELTRLLLEAKLGQGHKEYRWFMSSVWLENTLEKQPPSWLPPGVHSYNDLLASAVEAAVTQDSAPRILQDWRWGQSFPVEIIHPVLRRIPFMGRWSSPGLHAQAGGSYTVKQVGRNFGPSERLTVDLSDFDKSTLNIVTGQSGHLLSPNYMDQWSAWYEGRTFDLPFSREAVDRTRAHQLTLEPK